MQRTVVNLVLCWASMIAGSEHAHAQTLAPVSETETTHPTRSPFEKEAATVHVKVENVEPDRGKVWVALCDTELSIEGCPHQVDVPASAVSVEATFNDIPPGTYAVAGFDDLNGNDRFDKILGVPREPYALSGAAGDKLVPKFRDAALEIAPGANDVTIRMRSVVGN